MNMEQTQPVIGILGGMSTEASKEYYHRINDGVQQRLGGHNVAEILMYSVNFQVIERMIRHEQWDEAGEYLAKKALLLEQGGADYLLLATNTMHKVRDAIVRAVSIPFIDIIEVTAGAIGKAGLDCVAMLGTYPTMTDRFYREAYAQSGVTVLTPGEDEKKEINRIIFEELCRNKLTPSSKQAYLDVIYSLKAQGAQGVILGCTEISLLIDQQDLGSFPVFDTTALHCEEGVRLCLGKTVTR